MSRALCQLGPPEDMGNGDWCSPKEAAKFFRRTQRRVREWCTDGTLTDFGYLTFQDSKGHWYIHIPRRKTATKAAEAT